MHPVTYQMKEPIKRNTIYFYSFKMFNLKDNGGLKYEVTG